ncbi:E3 Ubiquitin ligase [Pedobacter xixiisoli]|uniref:RING-type E3 ubiquitin transferase n=2 Tax=Pedobacter xixiisoli TaxID=1476464 RepID=A0A285ZUM6_9SPHI|nr:E3 Ubiquitin ligase [Pedobacter xixiisoli]
MPNPFVSNNLKNIGCVVLCFGIALGVFFTKFLVPVIPLLIGSIAYFSTIKLKNITFKEPQKIAELNDGQVLLEGTVLKLEEEINSPYFNETCIGYLYKEIEYIPIDDGYNDDVKSIITECKNFTLSTNSGNITIKGNGLDLKQLNPRTHNEHSLKPDINDVGHVEHLLKNNDQVVIIGTAIKNIYQRLEIGKKDNEPFFVTTKSKIETQKISFQVLKRLFPWMCILYLVVNYILFFAPNKNIPKSDVFAFVAIFGLPVLFVVFWVIGKDKKDWFSQVFQYLASVCILSSLLSFPLIILFYMIELEFYKIYYIFISVLSVVALALIFNLKKLTAYNNQHEKIKEKS